MILPLSLKIPQDRLPTSGRQRASRARAPPDECQHNQQGLKTPLRFSVALRTGVFDGEMGYVYGGCGIVGESDADAEYEEIDLKLRTILSAFGA